MKRSEINRLIREGEAFVRAHGFLLPPFAFWTPQQWASLGLAGRELTAHGLGWDLTDFGLGDYEHFGLLLFTLRNGSLDEARSGVGRTYAEKVLLVGKDQVTKFHFHHRKTEDIINRGGGTLELMLHNATLDDRLADTPVTVQVDALERTLPPGGLLRLAPGESVTLRPGQYHQFTARGAPVLAGEVSSVNDDHSDNVFLEPLGRFPRIEEDEAPERLLVGDYARLGAAWPG
ncbi:D-lyxose/D-mannose family sugar isomerase [Deinococcus koreensis]|uniref:D-lyxose ketol-isomerase n=1 Tax=Deinococcus koreensis TaxID=2054903 RepID=A0A2K3UT33_9DEIO|nr:D-lyxose/D-mannose family sugar isomerase [Deinococcus koreensis]PNY79704.1 D-lyxose/D-mannose family sugar isomerase [Deinococcus koreensis]